MAAAAPIGHSNLQSPFPQLDFSTRKRRCWNFVFRIFASLILVISIAYFPSKALGFVSNSGSSFSREIFYVLVTGFLVCCGLVGWRSVEKNQEAKMSSDKLTVEFLAKMLNVDFVSDWSDDFGYASSEMSWNALFPNSRWLGLPVRSLKCAFTITEKGGVKCRKGSFGSGLRSSGGVCGERFWAFGDLGPLNLLEKFDEAAALSWPVSWRCKSSQIVLREETGNSAFCSDDCNQFKSAQLRSFKKEEILLSSKSLLSELECLHKAPSALHKQHIDSIEKANTTIPAKDLQESALHYATQSGFGETGLTDSHRDEVDRKASEFIAKFRAQMRLQKVASAATMQIRG